MNGIQKWILEERKMFVLQLHMRMYVKNEWYV